MAKRNKKAEPAPVFERVFRPRTENQQRLVEAIRNNTIVVAIGPAGCGKTALCSQTAVELLYNPESPIERIVVVRLIADTHNEHLGALPGDRIDKLIHFGAPVLDNLRQLLPEWELATMLQNNTLEIAPISHMLGRTFINTAVLVEEAQCLDDSMVLLLLTRIGQGSILLINGDPYQTVIPGRNGIETAALLVDGLPGCAVIRLDESDIQRHPLVRAVLARAEKLDIRIGKRLII